MHYYSSYFLNTVKIPYHGFFLLSNSKRTTTIHKEMKRHCLLLHDVFYSRSNVVLPHGHVSHFVCYHMRDAVCICQWPYLCLPVWISRESREDKIEIRGHWLSEFKTDRQQQSWLLIKVRLRGLGSVTAKRGAGKGGVRKIALLGICRILILSFRWQKNILNEKLKFKWSWTTLILMQWTYSYWSSIEHPLFLWFLVLNHV